MKQLALAALLLAAALAPARADSYAIETHSPESWAHYYQLIGLGTVLRGPFNGAAHSELTLHCKFLEDLTEMEWIPLGYSLERGYKLCYRTGPFSPDEAEVFCARLVMEVKENLSRRIVCERTHHSLRYPWENPYRLPGMETPPAAFGPAKAAATRWYTWARVWRGWLSMITNVRRLPAGAGRNPASEYTPLRVPVLAGT
jgi:hypothetical protein